MQANRWIVLIAVLMAFVPIVVDMTILHIAVPSLTLALQATSTEILWIIDIYPLMMAGLLVPMGALADRVGNRKMLLAGLAIFLVASVIAAFSPNAAVLIGARVLLAVGAAMVMPNILAVIRQTFDNSKELGLALGLWGTIGSAGAALGPLVGGFLLEHYWWGSVFLINVPVMLVVWPLVFFNVPERAVIKGKTWNVGQALVLIAGLILSVYALKSGFKAGNSVLVTAGAAVVGLALLAWFANRQLRSADPMLDLTLFSRPAISMGMVIALVVSGSLAGVELTLAQELQFVVGLSPLAAGMFMMPLALAAGIGGPIGGMLAGMIGLRWIMPLSLLIAAGALAVLGLGDLHDPGLREVAILAVLGLALSIGLTASSLAIMSSAPPEKAGVAGSLEATGFELGAGLGITMFGVLLSASYRHNVQVPTGISDSLPEGALNSIGETMMAASKQGAAGDALVQAGKAAFSAAHTSVLLTSATVIGLLAVVVFFALKNHTTPSSGGHGH